jgi:hypothetical protein
MYKHVSTAQGLLEQDGDLCIEVLKLLAETRWASRQGTAAIMTPCLDEKLGAVQAGLGDSAINEIDQLIKLAGFSLVNLCLSCHQEVGRTLIETRSVGAATTVLTRQVVGLVESRQRPPSDGCCSFNGG